jgi:hypothetical protein
MNIKNLANLFVKYYYLPLSLMLVVGGLGIESIWISWTGMFIFSVLLLALILQKGQLKFPPGFRLFLIAVILIAVNLFWSADRAATLKYLLLFIGGGAAWLFVFNYPDREKIKKEMTGMIIFLAVFFGQYVVIERIIGGNTLRAFAITGYSSPEHNHHHIGDFFAVVASMVIYKILFSKEHRIYWLLGSFISFIFIFFSESRSAFVSLGVAMFLLFWKENIFFKHKRLFIILFSFLVLAVLYFAQYKSLFLSREYFLQSLAGLWNNPLGVGIGNFVDISKDLKNHIFGADNFSTVTHNLPLEFLSGMGFFGFVFFYFYIDEIIKAIKKLRSEPVFSLIFITLSINFFFDFTYLIPTMLWLWFVSLGLANSGNRT